ncbi:IS66 family insertion sequence element accessory protein TnpA [Cerasicoccus frondis]|uniref:IS66 family insertion sequence element accessory protein TnpA n=1 Tax=Cerasicoccus frondis TaxID=490090 RepID=UPI0028527FD6|nr:hypothetical protein [Cerasicoccus frondis]
MLKTDALGRVKVPPKKRETILDAFEQSGMSGSAFASHIGVTYQTFATWVQKRRRQREAPISTAERKQPLELIEAVIDTGSADALLEMEVLGGIKLRLSRREDIALVVELLRALQD